MSGIDQVLALWLLRERERLANGTDNTTVPHALQSGALSVPEDSSPAPMLPPPAVVALEDSADAAAAVPPALASGFPDDDGATFGVLGGSSMGDHGNAVVVSFVPPHGARALHRVSKSLCGPLSYRN